MTQQYSQQQIAQMEQMKERYAQKRQEMQQNRAAALMSYPVPPQADLVIHEREEDVHIVYTNANSVTILNFGWIQILDHTNQLLALFPVPNVRSIVFEYPKDDTEEDR